MASIEWQVKKETFNPEKNYFTIDYVMIHREESEEEIKLYNKMVHYDSVAMTHGIALSLTGIFGAIMSGTLFVNLVSKPWGLFGVVLFLILGFLSIPAFRINAGKSDHYKRAWELYKKENDVWETCPEALEIKAYNDEQQRIAEEWRAAHPLEEHIRACLKDPHSSVDVANLARYYAEVYLKGDVPN